MTRYRSKTEIVIRARSLGLEVECENTETGHLLYRFISKSSPLANTLAPEHVGAAKAAAFLDGVEWERKRRKDR